MQMFEDDSRPTDDFRCPECGALRFNVSASGSICPNNHGRIQPPVPQEVHRKAMHIPEATKIDLFQAATKEADHTAPWKAYATREVFTLAEHNGFFRRISRVKRDLTSSYPSSIVGLHDGSLLEFVRWEEFDAKFKVNTSVNNGDSVADDVGHTLALLDAAE